MRHSRSDCQLAHDATLMDLDRLLSDPVSGCNLWRVTSTVVEFIALGGRRLDGGEKCFCEVECEVVTHQWLSDRVQVADRTVVSTGLSDIRGESPLCSRRQAHRMNVCQSRRAWARNCKGIDR